MGRYTAESTGMDVLRPIAAEQLKKYPSKKTRIWSDKLEAWGFFAEDEITKNDIFLLWCSASPGDRLVFKLDEESNSQVSTIVGVWREVISDVPSWVFRLIDQSGRLVCVTINESELFLQASKSTF
jgi:hypothetical protein